MKVHKNMEVKLNNEKSYTLQIYNTNDTELEKRKDRRIRKLADM